METQDTQRGFSSKEFVSRSRHLESLAFCSPLEACSKWSCSLWFYCIVTKLLRKQVEDEGEEWFPKHSSTPVLNLANVSVPSRGKRESRQMAAKNTLPE